VVLSSSDKKYLLYRLHKQYSPISTLPAAGKFVSLFYLFEATALTTVDINK